MPLHFLSFLIRYSRCHSHCFQEVAAIAFIINIFNLSLIYVSIFCYLYDYHLAQKPMGSMHLKITVRSTVVQAKTIKYCITGSLCGNDRWISLAMISPWAKTQIFTYRYHLGGQNLVMFFMYTYYQCIIHVFIFSDLPFISKIKLSRMVVLMKCNSNNIRGYQFSLDVSVSWNKKLKL